MNREVMSRQMFRNGGVVYMAEGGRPEVVETFSAIFSTGDADKILDYFISHERELKRAAASNEKLGIMIDFIENMEARRADETIAETQRLSEMPQTGMIEVPAPGGSSYIRDPREELPFKGEEPQPPINLETFFQEYRQTPTTPPQPQQPQQPGMMAPPQQPGMMGEVPMQYFQEGGMAMPAPMPAAPGPEGIASLPNEASMEAMPVEGVANEASRVGLDPAVVQRMLGEVDSTLGDLENAGSYEDVINGIREADAPIEARYKELAGFVGEEDAMRTPESVLTMVQPVIMMAGVDQGIGALASEEMTAPVTGDLAGGIMSTVNMGEEGVPPVNFNLGGAVQYFAPANENRVAGAMPGGRLGEFYTQFQPVYAQVAGIGDREQETKQLEDAAQADLLFSLARFGLNLASPEDTRRSPAEQLAAAAKDPLAMAQVRMGELAKDKRALTERDRAANLAALQAAQQSLTAEEKVKAETEAREDEQRHQIFLNEIQFDQQQKRDESAFGYSKRLQENQATLSAKESNLDRIWKAKQAVLDRASREGMQLNEFDFKKLMQEEMQRFQKEEAELGRVFTGDQAALDRNIKIAALDFEQFYKRRGLDLQEIRQKWEEEYQRQSLDLNRERLKVDEAYNKARIDLEKRQQDYTQNKQNKEFETNAINNPNKYLFWELNEPVILKEKRSAAPAYQQSLEGTPGVAGEFTDTRKTEFFKAWAEGKIPVNHPKARLVSAMLENYGPVQGRWSPDGTYVEATSVTLPDDLAVAVLQRANLKDTDISPRVRTKFAIMLAGGKDERIESVLEKMSQDQMTMLDGLAEAYKAPKEKVVAAVASDVEEAFGVWGAAKRNIDRVAKALVNGKITGTGASERGAFVLQRLYVDGLQSALQAMSGKENKALQDLLASVQPGNARIFANVESFYNESALYLSTLSTAIYNLEQQAKRTGSSKETQQILSGLADLYATRNGVRELMEVIKYRNPGMTGYGG